MSESVTLSSNDIQRLEPLLSQAELSGHGELPLHLAALATRLGGCRESVPAGVPADIVTMNSRARLLDLDDDSEHEYELVFPRDSATESGRISVLAPLGAALLGARVGKIFEVRTPRGVRRLQVRELVFQPEAAGRYDL